MSDASPGGTTAGGAPPPGDAVPPKPGERAEAANARPVLSSVRLALACVCAVLLFALMAVTVVDVVGRYVFSRPLLGASEMTELLLAAVVFAGLPAVCLDDGHVTVDLVTARLPRWTADIQLLVVRLVTAGALGLVAWRLAIHGGRVTSYGEVSIFLRIPVGPIAYGAAILCALGALLTLALVVMRAGPGGLRRG